VFQSQEELELSFSRTSENLVAPEIGPAALVIPDWTMRLWAYPNDPFVPGLHILIDTNRILALAKAAPEKFGLRFPPAAITADMVKYLPSRRCVYIYQISSNDGSAPVTVYAKAYRSDENDSVYTVMKQIWESAARQNGDLIIPQPYSYDAEAKILWQEALSGRPLAKVAETIPNFPEVGQAIGQRLAAFHGLRLDLPKEMTLEFQIKEMQRSVAVFNEIFSQYAERCKTVLARLLNTADRLEAVPETPVHASFKLSHIFLTSKGVAFIDFDGVNLGDPGQDLGRFIAHLYKMVADGKLDAQVAEQTIAGFCRAYMQAATTPMSQQRIDWFAASHLIASQVFKSVKRMDAENVSKLLHYADRLCPV